MLIVGEQLSLDGMPTIHGTARPPTLQARTEIARLQARGYGWTAIARSLNNRNIPTPSGRGRWHPDSVRRHIHPAPWRDYIRRYRLTHGR
jgi:Recombinase